MAEFKSREHNSKDTIAAIATFPCKSALGVIKISGSKSFSALSNVFKPARKKNMKKVRTFTLHYGWIINRRPPSAVRRQNKKNKRKTKYENHVVVDEVLVSVMRKPHSYTREDVVEISSHGGPTTLNEILEIILKEGIRPALPGEFTYRALINGRIDLLQAESINAIVEAKTVNALEFAAAQLKGEASKKIRALKEEIKDLFIETESYINFPEDSLNISLKTLSKRIEILKNKVNSVIKSSNEAKIIHEGLRCVICGRSNVGKSTLFNYLFGQERVIISKTAGTTRDVIEETINVKGVFLRIYDTAGILEPKDLVSKKALQKASLAFDEADLVILVLDSSRLLEKEDFLLLEKARNKNTILVINKIDLPQRLSLKRISKIKGTRVRMSALKKKGLESLEKAVYNNIYKKSVPRENIIFLSQYQRQILKKIKDNIQESKTFLEEGQRIDFINLSLKNCLDDLALLTGEVLSEEILESIFSNFCIGK